jgi:hypothetical protein
LIVERVGFPEKIVSLLHALHAKALVNFEVEGVRMIESAIGVKQVDLGPLSSIVQPRPSHLGQSAGYSRSQMATMARAIAGN